ncbi:hypothetical protein TcCL_Unassigned04750, partial [Trypanosoma cruzi]
GTERTNSTHTAHIHTHICMLSRVAAVKAPRTQYRRSESRTITESNTSETRPEFAFVRNTKVAPTPPEKRSKPVTEPKEDPVDDAMSGSINVELLQGVDLFVPQTTLV